MKYRKSTINELIASTHKLAGKISSKLGVLEGQVDEAVAKVPIGKRLDFYERLINLHNGKAISISNTITEIQNNGRRQEDSTKTCEAAEGQTG